MKKILLLVFLFAGSLSYGQQSSLTPILETYGITLEFPFGCSTDNMDFKEYSKDRVLYSKIRGSKYISNLYYYTNKNKDMVCEIGIVFKDVAIKDEFISSLNLSDSEVYTSIVNINGTTTSNTYNRAYFDKFVIQHEKTNRLEIICYDYASHINTYDEFEKIRMSCLDFSLKLDCRNGFSESNFVYFSKDNIPIINFSFSYEGPEWMLAEEVIFLLDNGDTIRMPLNHSRNLEDSICKELCVANIDIDTARILLRQSSAKYRILGEKFSKNYILNPGLISALSFAIICFDEDSLYKTDIFIDFP